MKKIQSFLVIFVTVLFMASCKKDNTDPVCNTVCENGGKVTPACDCDCPPDFTGKNCQTPTNPSKTVNVSINKDIYHTLPLLRYAGDNEYGGNIRIDGTVTLVTGSNNTKVYGVVNATYIESNGGDTKAKIDGNLTDNRILLYTAPAGKKIISIKASPITFYWYPSPNYHDKVTLTVDKFVYKIEMIGDTSGDDLPSDGTEERSRFRIRFDDFTVTINNQ